MTELEELQHRRIAANGPLSVADYMAECLFHPQYGYYTTREPFGRGGDFITAPEISQMFGEIVGAWMVHAWHQAGCPSPFIFAEIGPGRGTLMRDMARVAALNTAFLDAADIMLIEQSDRLAGVQKETLGERAERITWLKSICDLPDRPLLLVSNELFDALPIRQFVKTQSGWRERVVTSQDGQLAFGAGAAGLDPALLPNDAADAPHGAIFEIAPAREALQQEIAAHLATHGGLSLAFDYGHGRTAIGDTLQAVKNHAYCDALSNAGDADLTSHVDFDALARATRAAGANALPLMTQGQFLLANGLLERAGQLGAGKDSLTQDAIRQAVNRLAGDGEGQMGSLFKVFCATGKGIQNPLAPFG